MSIQDYFIRQNQKVTEDNIQDCIARQGVKGRNKEISEMLDNIN